MKRNRFAYILALTLAAAFIFMTESDTAYAMLYVLIIIPILSFLHAFIAIQGLSVRHFFRHSAITKGDDSDIIVMLENHSFLPVHELELVFAEADIGVLIPNIIFIKKISSRSIEEKVVSYSCKYRGQFHIGVDHIKIFDVLKLFTFKKKIESDDFVLVYPKTFPVLSFPVKVELTMREDAKKASIMDDYYTIADIRKFTPSDSLKKVHWKLSAKRCELLVKRHQASGNNAVVMVLDMSKLPVKDSEKRTMYEDGIMGRVLSVIRHITDRQMHADLIYASDSINIFNCAGIRDFHALRPILAKAEFDSHIPPENILRKIIKNKDEIGNIVFFTPNLTEIVCQNLIEAKKLGHNVILVYFNCLRLSEGMIRELETVGIHCFSVSITENSTKQVNESA
ncbi:MAG: DUF58 domain-containing protein [Defluviitaleaceae bacterium]|nr:DUF58 domain-containing protein [Defluviitaleaceae bacterium]